MDYYILVFTGWRQIVEDQALFHFNGKRVETVRADNNRLHGLAPTAVAVPAIRQAANAVAVQWIV